MFGYSSAAFRAPVDVHKFVFVSLKWVSDGRALRFCIIEIRHEVCVNVLLCLHRARWSTGWPVRCMQPAGRDPLPQWGKV